MSKSDPIGDMLTRIRNAVAAKKPTVEIPASGFKIEIAKILVKNGFVKKFVVIDDGKQGVIKILLKYVDGVAAINGIVRSSTPGRRIYAGVSNVPKILNGLGYSIVSTSKGILTDKECRSLKVGGEVICKVW